jgi:polyhydroxyalkanoate synthesis regulator phasin
MSGLFESGMEFLNLSEERIETIISDMVKSGKMDEAEAIEFRTTLVNRLKTERKQFKKDLDILVSARIKKMKLVTHEQFHKLAMKVKALESYVDEQARGTKK